ncbi:MAG: hypothetical protein KC668_30850, partial [Myxococcales bacterium]|nr:hypothetical protein [Myxococcales bacterium]
MKKILGGLSARRALRAVAVAFLLLSSFAGSGGDCSSEPIPPQTWRLVGDRIEIPGLHSQGVASLPTFGPTDRVYTSRFT